uniref:Uncharacterized protein n=1 Tax=Timema bartmani TaxID=61472 RepID=A0A7R9F9Q6_9NEOP|nr:unnamed protein product [Timema bartmani]
MERETFSVKIEPEEDMEYNLHHEATLEIKVYDGSFWDAMVFCSGISWFSLAWYGILLRSMMPLSGMLWYFTLVYDGSLWYAMVFYSEVSLDGWEARAASQGRSGKICSLSRDVSFANDWFKLNGSSRQRTTTYGPRARSGPLILKLARKLAGEPTRKSGSRQSQLVNNIQDMAEPATPPNVDAFAYGLIFEDEVETELVAGETESVPLPKRKYSNEGIPSSFSNRGTLLRKHMLCNAAQGGSGGYDASKGISNEPLEDQWLLSTTDLALQ